MTWEIEITGDKSDLENLSKMTKNEDLCIVQENEHFILKSKDFDVLSDHDEVKTKAIELLKLVSAYAKLVLDSRKAIELESIYWMNEKGNRKEFFEDTCVTYIICKDSFEITHSDGTVEAYNEEMPVVNCMKIAQRDNRVKKALNQINRDFNSWDSYYKIIEILEEDQFTPIRKKSKKINEGKYWQIANKITEIANSYPDILLEARHAKGEPKDKNFSLHPTMTLSEAKKWIKIFLQEWLNEKEQTYLEAHYE